MSFFNRFAYGKNKRELRPDNLPRNRLSLFFEMLKLHAGKMVALNLVFLLFVIPIVLWSYINLASIQYGYSSGDFAGAAQQQATEISQEQILQNFSDWIANGYLTEYMLVLVPLLMLMGLGMPGLIYVTRQWSQDEHVWLVRDFMRMLRENWKRALLVGFIDGAALFFAVVGTFLYSQMFAGQAGLSVYLAEGVLWLVAFLVLLMNVYIWPLMVTYEMPLWQMFKNAILLAVGKLPKTLLALLLAVLPLLLVYVHLLWGLYYVLIGFSLSALIANSIVNSVFDQVINPQIEGAPVRKGMHTPEPDDEDEEDIARARPGARKKGPSGK